MTARPTVLFVGESPPLGAPAGFRPFDCPSGDRLAKLMGMRSRAVLLDHVPRANIFNTPGTGMKDGPAWDSEEAAVRGSRIIVSLARAGTTIVSFGRMPAMALGIEGSPPWGVWRKTDADAGPHILIAPHPSGQSAALNGEPARVDCRRYLLPEVVLGCPTLRPWHFHLENSDVLRDLAAAISPHDVALGIAALRVSDEVHRAVAGPRESKQSLIEYRSNVDVTMRALTACCAAGLDAATALLAGQMTGRQLIALGREMRSRARASAKEEAVRDYPVAVLRATIGRHAALGVS